MSNAYGITETNLLAQLPRVLAEDESANALGAAAAEALANRQAEIPLATIYTRIDELDEDLLDQLAYDFKIDWYGYDLPIQAKRNLLKTNWYVHRHRGTTAGVRTAIQAIYPKSDVEEWWQDWYDNGQPYHFTVVLDATENPVFPVRGQDFFWAVGIYKPVRSWLDGVAFRASIHIKIGVGARWLVYYGRVCGTYPYRKTLGKLVSEDLTLHTHAEGIGYRDPFTGELVAGTHPAPAVLGDIEAHDLTIEALGEWMAYRDPFTKELVSGTHPAPAVLGDIEAHDLTIEAFGDGLAYRGPISGTNPQRAVEGEFLETGILVDGELMGLVYRTPYADESMTGTLPEPAMSGGANDGALSASSDGASLSFYTRMCGSAPGNLF